MNNYFGKMTDFLDFEAVEDSNVNETDNTDENLVENVNGVDFIDDGINLMEVLLTITLLQM